MTLPKIILVIIVAVVILVMVAVLFDRALAWRYRRNLKALPVNELKARVFRYERDYFRFLGEQEDAVQEFEGYVASKDLNKLQKHWPQLEREFLKLERSSGHHGRPLIFDYYISYRDEMSVLRRKLSDKME